MSCHLFLINFSVKISNSIDSGPPDLQNVVEGNVLGHVWVADNHFHVFRAINTDLMPEM